MRLRALRNPIPLIRHSHLRRSILRRQRNRNLRPRRELYCTAFIKRFELKISASLACTLTRHDPSPMTPIRNLLRLR